jgi:hypothetical protein
MRRALRPQSEKPAKEKPMLKVKFVALATRVAIATEEWAMYNAE